MPSDDCISLPKYKVDNKVYKNKMLKVKCIKSKVLESKCAIKIKCTNVNDHKD